MTNNEKFLGLNMLTDLQFIPVNDKKQPILKNWQTIKGQHDLSKCWGVGLVCGEPSGNVEVVDIDCKYDIIGNLYDDFKRAIHSINPDLLKKIVVQKTMNNGYHFIYRCSKILGNQKLANRNATEEEKSKTYNDTYAAEVLKGKSDEDAKKIAQKASDNDKVRVLIETRGIGGMVVIAPTDGYEITYGDIYSINQISEDERDIIMYAARSFNTYYEEVEVPTRTKLEKTDGKSPFEDYDERGDIIGLLTSNGWKVVGTKGVKTHFLRPGQTNSQSSGNFDSQKNWFSVFSTSTEFEPNKGYRPYAVFAYLECNKDFSAASKKLLDMGYGEKLVSKKLESQNSTRKVYSRIEEVKVDNYFAQPKDYETYLQQVLTNTLPQGLTTGIPSLDEFFLFKHGNFVNINGIDNVGKSVVMWYLMLLSCLYHKWKWVVFSSENSVGSFMRRMIQFYWGKPISGQFAMSSEQYIIAKEFIEKNFFIIKSEEELFNYKDILQLVKKKNEVIKIDGVLIDPYNSLKIDLSGFSKLSTHEFHYEALSEIKQNGKAHDIGYWINHHAVTSALRTKDDNKFPVPPRKEDTEGGGKVANKSDEFITIHRVTQHPTDWMVTEIHVRKVKETETGGKPTPYEEPVKLELYKGGCAFRERLEHGLREAVDPIFHWHKNFNINVEQQPIVESDGTINFTNFKPIDENDCPF